MYDNYSFLQNKLLSLTLFKDKYYKQADKTRSCLGLQVTNTYKE